MKFTDIPFHILDDIFDKGQMAILVCLMKYIVLYHSLNRIYDYEDTRFRVFKIKKTRQISY